ncbi:MAG: TetR/AcrR family transcriptional regulator [Alphaproteobacteria bacterium]|nr:TetR/AcrR family transcriptional regulator [Alphaproteobacteria bacterium]MDE2110121.1 TetR/AcrR family transcriptional regulator [Alphaproteobacteria bacterium]MDE2492760.1 TetR/AcrR family transcriptional regulator [Alphaproteobacteria bacterium]
MNQVSIYKVDSAGAKTARGKITRTKLLEAAVKEFGEKGFHAASISGITRAANVALGTFYVYFDSKEAIFRALVEYMGHLTRAFIAEHIGSPVNRLDAERKGLQAFIEFVRVHKDLYRIVMEAQFVADDAFRKYYLDFAEGYVRNLSAAAARHEISSGNQEVRAWALMGMCSFLGLRYAIWDDTRSPEEIVAAMSDLTEHGMAPRSTKMTLNTRTKNQKPGKKHGMGAHRRNGKTRSADA